MAANTKLQEAFFDESNEQMLDRLLYSDVQRRTGRTIDDTQKTRLVKTVKHYMTEIYRQNKTVTSIQVLNKEVLTAVIPDYMAYLQRTSIQVSKKEDQALIMSSDDPLRSDVSSRFAALQDRRNEGVVQPPAPPDFRVSLDDENEPSAMNLYERAKKQREAEAARVAEATQMIETEKMLRPSESMAIAKQGTNLINEIPTLSLAVQPDMRNLLFGGQLSRQGPANTGVGNPTTVLAERKSVLPQDFVQKEDDVVTYKETEYNLHVYSADRNWLVNTGENRYNFSVNFNPGNVVGTTFRPNTATQMRFKNITRVELVKALIPVEGIDVIIDKINDLSFSTVINTNALSFPYLMVRVPELDTNNVGTNTNLDNSFGVLQYDANWITDNINVGQRGGYIGMIPKFLKCQKVYHPTPLATLQKLSISLNRPDGTLLNSTLDTFDVSGFILSNSVGLYGLISGAYNPYTSPSPPGFSGGISTINAIGFNNHSSSNYSTNYNNLVNIVTGTSAAGYSQYVWIQSKTWFSRFMFNVGDRIQVQGIKFPEAFTGNAKATADFTDYIQTAKGLLVVNIGYKVGNIFYTGYNSVGYANWIIVQAKYADPTTGSTSISPFGGITTDAFATALATTATAALTAGRCINLSHQIQLVFRVITRDMDGSARLRPDNLN
jgi:hypothetical protein